MLKKQPNHGFFDNWRGITTKSPQHTPCLPSSCSLSKFLEMSHKPQINGALMEVLTLPKAGAALQQPHIPLLTPSLLPGAGIMQHLRESTHRLGRGELPSVLALLSSSSLQGRDLAGGFGSLAARGETKRAAISAKRSGLCGWWPPSPAGPRFKHTALGLWWGLGKALTATFQGLSLSPVGNATFWRYFWEVFAWNRWSGFALRRWIWGCVPVFRRAAPPRGARGDV